jgi:hypothetical protein
MRRIASPQGKLLAGVVWLGAVIAIVAAGLSAEGEHWLAMGVGIGVASFALGRLTGAYALAAPVAAIVPLALLSFSGSGEYADVFGWLLIAALLCAEVGAAFGVAWYAWAWTGTITREP